MRAVWILLISSVFSWSVTLADINSTPASVEKNFLIWEFLRQDINMTQATQAFLQITGSTDRFLEDYVAKTQDINATTTLSCKKQPASALMKISDIGCLKLALTPPKAAILSNEERVVLFNRLGGGAYRWLLSMNEPTHFTERGDWNASLELFAMVDKSYRQAHFDLTIDPKIVRVLSRSPKFASLVYWGVSDPVMEKLHASLSRVDYGTYDAQTHFYLGLNALQYELNDIAWYHFELAQQKAPSVIERDKATFWIYQATRKDRSTLQELSGSLDINMYVLYAREQLSLSTGNYFTSLPTTEMLAPRIEDPKKWRSFLKEVDRTAEENLTQLVDRYDGSEALALQAYILERKYTPYIHSFIMPYDQYMSAISPDRKALTYALMRQESRFLPGALSSAFAMGLMQLMPFLVDELAKTHPYKITSHSDMFRPEANIAYASTHLNYLAKYLYNPVLVAYAYNGGIGFTKRLLLQPKTFGKGPLEPFLSMELVSNTESREYAKRVLSNYVIYKQILGESVSIGSILDNLTQPTQSDYFRAEALKNQPPVLSRSE